MDPTALYELRGAEVHGPLGRALAPLDLVLRDHAVTALVGPVGSGKSTLLRLLSGRPPSEGWSLGGRWRYRGEELDPHRRVPLRDVAWVPQIRHAPAGAFEDRGHLEAARARLDAAFFCGARVLLLDEPTRGLPEQDRAELRHKLREQVDRGAAIVVTHDIELARAVADDVCMLYDGELVALRRATDFFEHPGSDLERQFVREGTCSMPPSVPGLPRHFYWLEPQRLAGMGQAAGIGDRVEDSQLVPVHDGLFRCSAAQPDPLRETPLAQISDRGHGFCPCFHAAAADGYFLSICGALVIFR